MFAHSQSLAFSIIFFVALQPKKKKKNRWRQAEEEWNWKAIQIHKSKYIWNVWGGNFRGGLLSFILWQWHATTLQLKWIPRWNGNGRGRVVLILVLSPPCRPFPRPNDSGQTRTRTITRTRNRSRQCWGYDFDSDSDALPRTPKTSFVHPSFTPQFSIFLSSRNEAAKKCLL